MRRADGRAAIPADIPLSMVQRWIEEDPETPENPSVLGALLLRKERCLIVRFVDDDEVEQYRDGVADSKDPDAAKRAYRYEPRALFAKVWLNQGQDGEGLAPSVQMLSQEEAAAEAKRLGGAKIRPSRKDQALEIA